MGARAGKRGLFLLSSSLNLLKHNRATADTDAAAAVAAAAAAGAWGGAFQADAELGGLEEAVRGVLLARAGPVLRPSSLFLLSHHPSFFLSP
jgi:hypothetical protein